MADDDLAYGEYHGQGGSDETGERGFLGDTFRRFAGGRRPGDPQQV
jgi:phospholipase D1/2